MLAKIASKQDLGQQEAYTLFLGIMDGQLDHDELEVLLRALARKGECINEIVGAARAMRSRVTPVQTPSGVSAIDTCSTGGDGMQTFNISTTVAIVAAAAGVTVAKHGNRSNARVSGSAEGLAALGINIEADVPTLEHCLRECRLAFLFAQKLHPAMRYVAPVRKKLGIRTIFNLVGPLTNPAGVRRQLLGVNRVELVESMGQVLCELGAERAMVVHGLDGMCDLSISSPSRISSWDGKTLTVGEVDCSVVGAQPASMEELFVGSPMESAQVIERVLNGQKGAARDIVVFNTAAALWVAGQADDWNAGVVQAQAAIDSGAAAATLAGWREHSRGGM
ncbi:MAG: anthranilate phosphoribosyltransferase [Planctomycetota bacterium]